MLAHGEYPSVVLSRRRLESPRRSPVRKSEGGTVMLKLFAVLLVSVGTAVGQSTTITISDSNGNQTGGTISSGNVYFVDSNGNATHGTIHDGNVFLSTSNGEVVFGTIRDGNVFLTDQKGNTTGTIRNGTIFLSNSDGSITTGTYNSNSSFITTTSTDASSSTAQQPQNNARVQPSRTAQSSYAVGQQLGNALAVSIVNHHIRSFCKKHPYGSWRFPNGTVVSCAQVNASN